MIASIPDQRRPLVAIFLAPVLSPLDAAVAIVVLRR